MITNKNWVIYLIKNNFSREEVLTHLKQKNIDFIFAQYVDIYGVTKAKLVPISHFEDLCDTGAGFAGFATYGLGVGPDFPDLHAIPDLQTLTILPWRKNVVRFACDIMIEEKGKFIPSPFCARSILKRVIKKVADQGLIFKVGMEPEFFLVKQTEKGIEVADTKDKLSKPCYDMQGLTRALDFLEIIINNINELGWDVEAADHEDANSQYEVNMKYDTVLNTADKYTFIKYMLSVLAEEQDMMACFMPKPFQSHTGNAAHTHMSLWNKKTGENIFLDMNDKNGMGMSQSAYNFIGGLLNNAKAYIAFTAPTVNSYKRLIQTNTVSGAAWSPIFITYGGNNRTQMLRIPGPGRIEDRTVDSSCNPYLALASILASGMDGINKKLDPGPHNDQNMYLLTENDLKKSKIELLPSTLKEAIQELSSNKLLQETFGQEFCDYYIKFKLNEWTEYHNSVSPWEIDKYLPLP